jgi:hypothetical protein
MRLAALVLAAAVLAGCGGGGDAPELGSSVDYVHNSGGVAGYRLSVHVALGDGRVTAEGTSSQAPCAPGRHAAKLPAAELARLKDALAAADLPHAESLNEPQVEAPDRRIQSGEVVFRHVGFEPLPENVQPLVDELERAASSACRAGGP